MEETAQSRAVTDKTGQKPAVRSNRKALLSKQSKLEAALGAAQKELAEASRQLADPATYTQRTRTEIEQLNEAYNALKTKINELEEDWLELETALEE
jgi:ATP-binding cassette subfamily F protein 3